MVEQEVADLKTQLTAQNAKLDSVLTLVNSIQQSLARQEGASIPQRVFNLEEKSQALAEYQAERAWMPEMIEEHTRDIKTLHKYLYMGLGIITLLQVVFSAIAGFVIQIIWKSMSGTAI
jgi:hypothetical protein